MWFATAHVTQAYIYHQSCQNPDSNIRTQYYCEVFLQHCTEKEGKLVILSEQLKNVFTSCRLHPTASQILNIISQANKIGCPKNSITFGLFCAAMYEFEVRSDQLKVGFDAYGNRRKYGSLRRSGTWRTVELPLEVQTMDHLNYSSLNRDGTLNVDFDDGSNYHKNSLPELDNVSPTQFFFQRKSNGNSKLVSSTSMHNFILKPHEVFLGGACNPTTWRSSLAIPFLKDNFTTYFNPQKENWSPEMIENEEIAKRSAKLLLFVLDCEETRGVVSMIEVCYLAGCKKPLLVALSGAKFTTSTKINGSSLDKDEVDDLNRALFLLNMFLDKSAVPIFSETKSALQACSYLLKHGKHPSCLNGYSQIPEVIIGESLGEIRRCFNEIDLKNRGSLTLEECCLALKLLFTLQHSFPMKFYNLLKFNLSNRNGGNLVDAKVTLDDFSAVAVDFADFLFSYSNHERNGETGNSSKWVKITRSQSSYFTWLSSGFGSSPESEQESSSRRSNNAAQSYPHFANPFILPPSCLKKDVFLGGSCGMDKWRESTVVPFLLEHGVTFHNPKSDNWDCSMLVKEEFQKHVCTVLFYYISACTRSVASMCEVAYYVGRGMQNVVLCIQPMDSADVTEKRNFSAESAKDYKRGRAYLVDIANQHHVPVFSRLEVALNRVLDKVKGTWV